MSTSNLNSSSWYIPGFNVQDAPLAASRIVTNVLGEFAAVVHTRLAGETSPATIKCAMFDLSGELLEAFLDWEGVSSSEQDDGSVEYTLSMPSGHVPSGDVEIRTYVDNTVHLSYACNNFGTLEEAVELEQYNMPTGLEVVEAGETEVSVEFDEALQAVPLVLFSLQSGSALVMGSLSAVSATGFTVELSAGAPEGLLLHWFCVRA